MFTFPSMGTQVSVGAPSLRDWEEHALALDVQDLFARQEARFSRFSERSELSSLHRTTGPTVVSTDLFATLLAARDHHRATGGLFDPAIGGALIALGYDRSFALGGLDRESASTSTPRGSFAEVTLDPRTLTVERPGHVRLDLGGLVKGRTVDRAAASLPSIGVIEAGGDAYLRGPGPEGTGWCVDVEDPFDARRVLVTLRVSDRGVATSAPNRRRWRVGSSIAHHLVDPRTQRPSTSDLSQVTVVAATAELAEVLSKTLYLLGGEGARHVLPSLGDITAVLVDQRGAFEVIGAPESVEVSHA